MHKSTLMFWTAVTTTTLGLLVSACMDPAPTSPETTAQDLDTSSISSDVTNPLPNCALLGHVFTCSVHGAVYDQQCFCPNTSLSVLTQAFVDGCTGCVEAGGTIADTGQGWLGETACNVCSAFGNPPPTCQ